MMKLFGNRRNSSQNWDEYEEDSLEWEEEGEELEYFEEDELEEDLQEEVEYDASADEYYAEESTLEAPSEYTKEYASYGEVTYTEDGYEGSYTEDGYEETYAEDGYEEGYTEEEYGEGYTEEEYGEGYTEEEYGEGYAEGNYEEGYAYPGEELAYTGEISLEEDDIEYMDTDEEEELIPPVSYRQHKKKKISSMDFMILLAGVAVLVIVFITGGLLLHTRSVKGQLSEFVKVGNQLEGIDLIGEKGLLAVADAEVAKIAAANAVFEEEEEEEEEISYEENAYEKTVVVTLALTSVQKDLKIKFSNKETGKLVSNIPFVVEVTKPDKSKETWSDDDMDGIIYKKNITPGKYSVSAKELDGEKYEKYMISTAGQTVEVLKDIAYQKVDVSNEIKKESEVNVSKEDTKKNETVVESTLQDTVEWVSSTVTSSTYTEVLKSSIPDPKTLTLASAFQRIAASISATTQSLTVGDSVNLTAEYKDDTTQESIPFSSLTWNSDNPSVATVDADGKVTAVAAGTSTVSYTGVVSIPSAEEGQDPKEETVTGVCVVTVTEAEKPLTQGTLTVEKATVALPFGTDAVVKTSVSGFTEGKSLVYTVSSDAEAIATASVDASGNVTVKGVKAGTANVKVSVNYTEADASTAATATIAVTVAGEYSITLDKTTATIFLTEPLVIKATVKNALSEKIVVTAESSDTNVLKVAVNGSDVTLTGEKSGSAVVTVKYKENNVEVKATCAVTVRAHPKDDKVTKLLDSNKAQLYVLENNNYREAVYADYYTADKFFLMNGIKYTGWQTIDGKVYYYNAKGVKVVGEQVIQGAKYNFASDGSLVTGSGTMGIDVSKWNGTIDWKAVKNSGISFVIIRCGYRGSTQGSLIEDSKFTANIKGANEAGLKVGVYFFTQAIDEVEAVYEASYVLEKIKNYKISYPIFLDVEPSGGRGDKIDKATRTAVCKAFCATIQNAGYTAGVYANKTWLNEKIDASALSAYKIWLAQYAATPTYTGRYDMWQYKSTGKVSGISGDVDLNTSYLGY